MSTETPNKGTGGPTVFGVIGWIGTLLVFASVAIRFLRPEWAQYQQYAAWAGLALVLVYLGGQWRDIATFYQGRSARYGTLSIVGVLVFAGILVAVNYLASRQNKRWDLTANQVYSLSEQTIKILQSLDAPVKFTVFDRELALDGYRDRLDAYTYQSSQVSAEYVDPEKNPLRARAAQIQSLGTIVVEYKDRTERATSSDEQALANALIKVVTGAEKKVYFTQGHGEKDTANSDQRSGYSAISSALSADNYGVDKLVLVQAKEVPADATVVVIAGPQTDFLQPEMDALKQYVARGGKVLALLDPVDDPSRPGTPLLNAVLREWGFDIGSNIVVDASGIGQLLGTDASVPVATSYPAHPITTNFQLMTAYPLARSVAPVEGGVEGRFPQSLVQTSAQSWAEADIAALAKGDGRVELNADKGDKPGPISLAAAVSAPAAEAPAQPEPKPEAPEGQEAPKPESRLAVIGDSDFISNGVLGVQGNRDFFMNTVNWLAQQENLIAIRPRE
ncbi:MAG: GldG family protein, partial [Acidobacteria bacterium]|nr:GldG family protein [Acidobacteriota bacterium]